MLFLLDENVDAAVGVMLRREGYPCLLAQRAGLSGASDDDVSVYAHNHHAVVVTHDEAFSRRRRKNVYGKHLWLRCREDAAPGLLRLHLPEVVNQMQYREALVMVVSPSGVEVFPHEWA